MYCRLSMNSTVRGSCTGLVTVGPTKYIILLCAKVIETTKRNRRFRYWHKFDASYGHCSENKNIFQTKTGCNLVILSIKHCDLLGLKGVLQILLIMLRGSKRKFILQRVPLTKKRLRNTDWPKKIIFYPLVLL